jgi:hypothetical protein
MPAPAPDTTTETPPPSGLSAPHPRQIFYSLTAPIPNVLESYNIAGIFQYSTWLYTWMTCRLHDIDTYDYLVDVLTMGRTDLCHRNMAGWGCRMT